MITLFPTPYPDELLYSQLSRYYAKSGYMAYIFAAEDLYVNSKTRPDIEFLNLLTSDAFNHIGKFLHSKLEGTKYLSPRGKARKMEILYKDFCEFYQGFQYNPLTQKWQLEKIFTNDRFNTYEVCMLAYFLDIPYNELVSMNLPQKTQTQMFDEKVLKLHKEGLNYRQISNQLNASYDVVKSIGEGRYGKYHYPKQRKAYKSKKRDWDSFDSMLLPKVKELLNTLTKDKNKRPQKITVGMIERLLGLPKKTLIQCPKCTYEIQKYYETQDEYWIREIN